MILIQDIIGGVAKNGYFSVRLTVTVNFSRIFYGVFKKQVFLAQKHSVTPFSVGQNFHICLRIFYGQAGRKGADPQPLRSA